MGRNDNLTLEIQWAIEREEQRIETGCKAHQPWWLKTLGTHYHPNIQGLPDYGLGSLKPETEAYCRTLCEKNGMSYEEAKQEYAAGRQVIQARQRNSISTQLISKGVCPINRLDAFFTAHIQGAVAMKRRLREERAARIREGFSSVD